jgi:hypothetical protein
LSRERNPSREKQTSSAKIFWRGSEDRLVSSFLARPTPLYASLLLVTASLFFLAARARADEVKPAEGVAESGLPTAQPDQSKAAAVAAHVRCPAVNGGAPSLAEIDARRRLAFVRQVMDDQGRRARTWTAAWMIAGLGLAVGNYTRAALVEPDERVVPLTGGTTALFIPAALLVRPLAVMTHQRALEAEPAMLSSSEGASGVCEALARAELLFARSAEDEAFQAGWVSHLLAIGGNGAVALFLGLGFDHWRGALLNGGGGLLIREFQIYTQPTGAVTELARYRRGELAPPSTSSSFPVRIVPWIAHGGAGLAAFGTF